jgi:hypothetical protein
MIQPKYSPRQALERAKLLMNYDSSKTLTENKEILDEQTTSAWATAPAAIGSGLVGGGLTAAGLGKAAVKTGLMGLNAAKKATLAKTAMTGGVTVAGIAATVLVTWGVIEAVGEFVQASTKEKIKKLGQGCDSSAARGSAQMRETMSNVQHQEVANMFREAFDWTFFGMSWGGEGGTDNSKWRGAMKALKDSGNFGDWCAIRERMGKNAFDDEIIDELNNAEANEVAGGIEILMAKSQPGTIPLKHAETANRNWWLQGFPCLQRTRSLKPDFQVAADDYGETMVPISFKVKGQNGQYTIKEYWLDYNGWVYTKPDNDINNALDTGKMVVCEGSKVRVQVHESISRKKKSRLTEQAVIDVSLDPLDQVDPLNPTPTPNPPRPDRRTSCSSGFSPCTGTYKICCSSPKIQEVQRCLGGLTPDGKWGDKTQYVIASKFPQFANSFTDNDVQTICGGAQPQRDEIEGEEEITDINNF